MSHDAQQLRPAVERRHAQRLDLLFPVWVESAAFGECSGIARNISESGMFVEMGEPLPLGSRVRVHFALPEGRRALIASGEVKRHYFLHYSDATGARALTGMGIRFTGFEEDGAERYVAGLSVARARLLH